MAFAVLSFASRGSGRRTSLILREGARGRFLSTLRVAGVPEHFNAPFHLAKGKGLYEEQGVNFEWAETPQGTGAMAQKLESGDVDMAVMLAEGAVAKAAAGAPFKVVGTYVSTSLRWGVHVRHGSEFRDIEDLKGKTFGVSRMLSGSHLMAHVMAQQRGWDPVRDAPLKIVHTLDGAREAMSAGEIHAWLWEKFTTKHLVDSGEWSIVGEVPTPWPCFLLVASEQAVAERAGEIQAVVKATKEVCDEFKLNANDATLKYVSENHRLNLDDSAEWLSGTQWRCALQVSEDTLRLTQEALVTIGQLTAPVAHEKLFDHQLCQLTEA